MDLEKEIINRKWAAAGKGYRPLDENETRDSSIGQGSCRLFNDKIYPRKDPKLIPPVFTKDPATGVVEVEGAAALSGTADHGEVQELVDDIIQSSEAKVDDDNGVVKTSGHIDLEYKDDNYGDVLSDIKTVDALIFDYCIGVKVPKDPKAYSVLKRKMAIQQANHYAIKRGKAKFNILWMKRGKNGVFKIEWFDVDEAMELENIQKLVDVENARRKYVSGDKKAFPPMTGVCECTYCPHSAEYTKFDKTPANCPGEEALKERLADAKKGVKRGVVG